MCNLEHQTLRFAPVRQVRTAWPHFFVAKQYVGANKSLNALVRGHRLCTKFSIFEKKSRRIASFLMLPTSNIEEVSQNFVVLGPRPSIL